MHDALPETLPAERSLDPIAASPLYERVYMAVRGAILRGDLQPGQVTAIDSLASRFQVSITPVREALARLQAEGLVDVTRGRRVQISTISEEEIRSLYDVRRKLGCYLLEVLVDRLEEDGDLRAQLLTRADGLRTVLVAIDERRELPEGYEELLKTDHFLSRLVLEGSPNDFLLRLVALLNNYILRLRLLSARGEAADSLVRLRAATEEHLELVEAVLSRDRRRLALALSTHLDRSEARLLGHQGDPAPSDHQATCAGA